MTKNKKLNSPILDDGWYISEIVNEPFFENVVFNLPALSKENEDYSFINFVKLDDDKDT